MKTIWIIARRELHSFFDSLLAYIMLIAFLGFRLHWFESLTLDTMVTIAWIVGITNAFNLLDNMDGLCAGIGFIAVFFLTQRLLGQHEQFVYVV